MRWITALHELDCCFFLLLSSLAAVLFLFFSVHSMAAIFASRVGFFMLGCPSQFLWHLYSCQRAVREPSRVFWQVPMPSTAYVIISRTFQNFLRNFLRRSGIFGVFLALIPAFLGVICHKYPISGCLVPKRGLFLGYWLISALDNQINFPLGNLTLQVIANIRFR